MLLDCNASGQLLMPVSRPSVERFVVLCVGEAGAAATALLRPALEPLVELEQVPTLDDAAQRMQILAGERAAVAVIVGSAAAMDSAALPPSMRREEEQAYPRLLALAADEIPSAADALVEQVDNRDELIATARELLTEYIIEYQPEALTRLCQVLDPRLLASALAQAKQASRALDGELRMLRHSILSATRLSDDAAEAQMLQLLQSALDNPPLQHVPAGTVLFREDDQIDGIWITIDGIVELTRFSGGREIVFHSKSVGRIVGLLALAGRQKTFFTARAITPVTAIHLTWSELDDALQREPALLLFFLTVHVRSLGKRLRRIVELQLQIEDLNSALAAERDHLAEALRQLRDAQARLIEQEKMATLGQLVAGVGHELNNPATAITRAADYVVEDASQLIRHLPEGEALCAAVQRALTQSPLPTNQLRRCRDELAAALGDEALARRLINVGIFTLDAYRSMFGQDRADTRAQRLEMYERAYQLGISLRNIRSSGEQISAIVKSLRSYARGEERLADVDLHEGLEDTLRLFNVRLQDVRVRRRYGEIPTISGWPAQLNQVWTNLIANALEAMDNRGELTLETALLDDGRVAVRIIDNGPGIPPEDLQRVFDLNFTTKRGGTGFGLGMGLLICRQIISRHRGQICIDSIPGRTCVEVILPTQLREEQAR